MVASIESSPDLTDDDIDFTLTNVSVQCFSSYELKSFKSLMLARLGRVIS